MLIGDLTTNRAKSSPEAVYWQGEQGSHRYDELWRLSHNAALAILRQGSLPGEHIAVFSGNSFAYAVLHFGAAKSGVVLAHLNARYTPSELADLTNHSDAVMLFYSADLVDQVEQVRQQLPRVRHFVQMPPAEGKHVSREQETQAAAQGNAATLHPGWRKLPTPDWAIDFSDWLAIGQARSKEVTQSENGEDQAGGTVELPLLDKDHPFQLLYTSGTTGTPKGALISHQAKLRQGTTHALNMSLAEGDRVLSALPMYHQFAQWLLMVSVPLSGATVVSLPGFDPQAVWHALRTDGITHLPAVPTMLYRLLDHPDAEGPPPSKLRCIVYGAAPVYPARLAQLRERFPGVHLFQGFGQTETGYCLGLHDADHAICPQSLGRPDLFSRVNLMDENGSEVPQGEVGEIVARTPYLMNGYFKNVQANEDYFAFGREMGRTGDMAWRDKAGYYHLAGRRDELIISGGVNVYPAEVERVLQQHPLVAEAAVLGLAHPDWGEEVVAAILLQPDAAQDGDKHAQALRALQDHCREQLADFKCPRRYFFLPDYPRTANGKVQKHLLREQLLGEG